MRGEASCLRHGRDCRFKTAFRHIAGTVCIGFSRRGKNLATEDSSMLATLAWCAQRRQAQETIVIQESVVSCPESLFKEYLHDLYHIERVVVDAVQLGWACGRQRQYLKFIHRVKAAEIVSPCSRFIRRFYRACQYSWREHFFAHLCDPDATVIENELTEELKWAHRRPSSLQSGKPVDETVPTAFEDSLNESERQYLATYRAQYPNQCYQLNQDPLSNMWASSSEWALQTIIHNCHLLWYDLPPPAQPRQATRIGGCVGVHHGLVSVNGMTDRFELRLNLTWTIMKSLTLTLIQIHCNRCIH